MGIPMNRIENLLIKILAIVQRCESDAERGDLLWGMQDELIINLDAFQTGECVVISRGEYALLRAAQIPPIMGVQMINTAEEGQREIVEQKKVFDVLPNQIIDIPNMPVKIFVAGRSVTKSTGPLEVLEEINENHEEEQECKKKDMTEA